MAAITCFGTEDPKLSGFTDFGILNGNLAISSLLFLSDRKRPMAFRPRLAAGLALSQ